MVYYKVIWAYDNLGDLIKEVNEHLKLGYRLIGGINTLWEPNEQKISYYHAMLQERSHVVEEICPYYS
jgi:hypothetical protein